MLVPRRLPQVFVSALQRHDVNIRPAHTHQGTLPFAGNGAARLGPVAAYRRWERWLVVHRSRGRHSQNVALLDGVAEASTGRQQEQVIQSADQALYFAKNIRKEPRRVNQLPIRTPRCFAPAPGSSVREKSDVVSLARSR